MPHELLRMRAVDVGLSFGVALMALKMESDAIKQARVGMGLEEDPKTPTVQKLRDLFGADAVFQTGQEPK